MQLIIMKIILKQLTILKLNLEIKVLIKGKKSSINLNYYFLLIPKNNCKKDNKGYRLKRFWIDFNLKKNQKCGNYIKIRNFKFKNKQILIYIIV